MKVPYRLADAVGRYTRTAQLKTSNLESARSSADVLVSLTTYPARVDQVWLTLRSLADQSVQPARIALYLSIRQFPGGTGSLPTSLRREVSRSAIPVKVSFEHGDQRSYKKLIPALRDAPTATIVTADDDVLYRRTWLECLLEASGVHPGHIVGTRARRITFQDARPTPYASWPVAPAYAAGPDIFLTGRGGILYPPGSLAPAVADIELARRLSGDADDVWFKAMAWSRGTPAASTRLRRDDPSSKADQRGALHHVHLGQSANDLAIAKVVDHFGLAGRFSEPPGTAAPS